MLSSLRYLFADFIGEDGGAPPFLPDGLPDGAAPVVSEGIHRLMDYQGSSYAQLYVDRLRRFIGRRDVDGAMFGEIARLMAMRMSYEDPIRIAQLKLAEYEMAAGDPRLEGEVVRDAQARDQIELLEHQAEPVPPQRRPSGIIEAGEAAIVEPDLAAVGGIESGDEVQERALAGAGFTR